MEYHSGATSTLPQHSNYRVAFGIISIHSPSIVGILGTIPILPRPHPHLQGVKAHCNSASSYSLLEKRGKMMSIHERTTSRSLSPTTRLVGYGLKRLDICTSASLRHHVSTKKSMTLQNTRGSGMSYLTFPCITTYGSLLSVL